MASGYSEWIADGPAITTAESLHELYRQAAVDAPSARAIACLHQPASFLASISTCVESDGPYLRWTHAELFRAAHATAQRLLRAGVRPGMRIVVFITSGIEWHLIFRACLEISCAFCPISPNTIKNEREVKHLFQIMEPSVFVVQRPSLASALTKLAPDRVATAQLKLVLETGPDADGQDQKPEGWHLFQTFVEPREIKAESDEKPFDYPNIERKPDDVVAIFTTSGTTSLPKGCPITNRVFVACSISMKLTNNMTSDRVICNHMPLNHSFAVNYVHQVHISGGCVVHPAGIFDAGASLKAIREEHCTDVPGVPAIVKTLLEHPLYKKEDMSSVRIVRLGATRISTEDYEACFRGFGAHSVINGFGMTEAGSHFQRVFTSTTENPVVKISPGLAVRICDPEDDGAHNPLPLGTPGELHVGGPSVIEHYWLAPGQEASDPFYDDHFGHWIKTGDQAVMSEEGDITIVGRYKDLIIRGGENVAPGAIEAILQTDFGLQAEVVALPDDVAGEVPVAIVKTKPGEQATGLPESQIKESIIRKYGPLYALEAIITLHDLGLEDFPRTTTNKVQKHVLRRKLTDYIQARKQTQKRQSVNGRDMLEALLGLWTRLLGLSKGTLTPQTQVTEWADSLVLARFPGALKKELQISMSLQDVLSHPEIASQAAFITSSQPGTISTSVDISPDGYEDLYITRKGPPQQKDLSSFVEDDVTFQYIQAACHATLSNIGLGWSDVEQITPLYDFQNEFLRRRRPQSYNHRHAWVCAAGLDTTRTAIENALGNSPMLRTMATHARGKAYHAVVRPSTTWFVQCITELDPIDSAEDLKRLKWNDLELDFAAYPGPLFRILLAPIRNPGGSTGMVYMAQHSVFDAITTPFFQSDLNALISGASVASLPRRVPFRVWVESTCALGDSKAAQRSVEWNVERLLRAGIGSGQTALFPKQRAPEWFKGDSTGWIDEKTGEPGPVRPSLDQDADGVTGFSREASFPGMSALKQEHHIDASQILKTALALLNCRHTAQSLALFGQYHAARTWPHLQPWQVARMPPAMEVNGPTVQMVVNAIRVKDKTFVLEMLKTLQEEQKQLSEHAVAPFNAVVDSLKGSHVQAGEIMYETWRRQIFNWLPIGPEAGRFDKMIKVQQVTRTDVGLLWNCRALGSETVQFMPSWDDAQLRRTEVESLLSEFIDLIGKLADRGNWNQSVGQLLRYSNDLA